MIPLKCSEEIYILVEYFVVKDTNHKSTTKGALHISMDYPISSHCKAREKIYRCCIVSNNSFCLNIIFVSDEYLQVH